MLWAFWKYASAGLAAVLLVACSGHASEEPAEGYQAKAFDVGELDLAAAPCDSLFDFVNKKWLDATAIPADLGGVSIDTKLGEDIAAALREIAEDARGQLSPGDKGSVRYKLGLLYQEAMDEDSVERAGLNPVQDLLGEVSAISSAEDVAAVIRDLSNAGSGSSDSAAAQSPAVVALSSGADYRDATRQVGEVSEQALRLPSKDYYSAPEHAQVLAAYRQTVAKAFAAAGADEPAAARDADAAVTLEAELAQAAFAEVDKRDPNNQFKFVTVDQAQQLTPHFDWRAFFSAQHASAEAGFSLPDTQFFAAFDRLLAKAPLAQWKAYLSFRVIDAYAPHLPKAFRENAFELTKTLRGTATELPKFKRALQVLEDNIGEGLGHLYVEKAFSPQTKAAVAKLVDRIIAAMRERIDQLGWMGQQTKDKAKAKLAKILPKIGYPDHWRDWSQLVLDGKGLVADIRTAQAFVHAHEVAKIGKPTDRQEWTMTPQTVNAYYEPTDNTINFPAGILQAPYFDLKADPALNYGAIGAVIGHEMTHAFDDEGSQFDGDGNQVNWWTEADRKSFEERTGKLAAQFDAYAPVPARPDAHVNGKLTLGENIADLGGALAAFDALRAEPATSVRITGYNPAQRFFLAYARSWRGKRRDEAVLTQISSNPHSPEKYRVDGVVPNVPAFAEAFSCAAGSPMAHGGESLVSIW